MKDKRFLDFNKEIVLGEIGAILGASIVACLAFLITQNPKLIPTFAVMGSIFGGSTLFLLTKAYDKKKAGKLSFKSMITDLSYYTPIAVLIGIFVGYPFLYLLAKYLVKRGFHSYSAGALSEFSAFMIFLVIINVYRFVLVRVFKKEI